MRKNTNSIQSKRVSKTAAVETIKNNGGRIMTISYTKNNGQPRTHNCILAAHQLHNQLGYITVYDMQEKDFKQVSANRITSVTTNGIRYKVRS